MHRRLRARRGVLRDPAARAGQDGRRAGRSTSDSTRIVRAGVQLVPDPTHPHRGVRHPAPHRGAGRHADRLPGHLRQPVDAASSRCTSTAGATSWRTRPRSCPAPTRRWPRWSATSSASTRSPARCRRWRSRTWSRSATSTRSASGWRWSAASPTRSRATSSSSAPTAGCSSLQLDELIAGVEPERELVVRDYLPGRRRSGPARVDEVLAELDALSATELLDLGHRGPGHWARRRPRTRWTRRSARAATGCWPRCRGCPARSSTGWSTTSAGCRSCWPRDRRPAGGRGRRRGPGPRLREGLSRLAESSILERYV